MRLAQNGEKEMAKKIAVLSLVILLASFMYMFAMPRASAASTTALYINPPAVVNPALLVNSTFTIFVKLDNVSADPGLAGIEFNVSWDPSILNGVSMQDVIFNEVTPPDQLGNIWKIKSVVAAGSVAYAYTFQDIDAAITGGYAPISGSHTVANITLKVVGIGKCALHFYVSKLGDPLAGSIAHDTTDGFFNNIPPPPAPGPAPLSVNPAKISNPSLTTGTNFTVNINIVNASNVAGLEFKLGYNISALNAIAVNGGSLIGSATPTTVIDNVLGFVMFNVSLAPTVNGSGTVAVVQFQVMADGVNKSPLHLYDVSLIDGDGQAVPSPTTDGSFTNIKIVPGDINEDGVVDISDAILASHAFGSTPSDPHWNPAADLNDDGQVDIFDFIILVMNFGHTA
jgi:hypothetical protein